MNESRAHLPPAPTAEASELAAALAKFHETLPDVTKGSTNPAFKSKYADLADIVKAVLPKLAAQGLAWMTTPTFTDHGFVLAYELRHVSGESVRGEWPLPDPTAATPQQLGSAVTYAKRYTLSAVTGIAPDGDDDGNAASASGAPRAATARPPRDRINSAKQALEVADTIARLDEVWAAIGVAGMGQLKELTDVEKRRRAEFAEDGQETNVDAAWAPVREIPA